MNLSPRTGRSVIISSKMNLTVLLDTAIAARAGLISEPYNAALRLFNGFYEGCPELVADLYARTLVLHNYADPPEDGQELLESAREQLLARLPWITCVVRKTRSAASSEERCGQVVWGGPPARRVRENGVWYALNLTLNQDAGFYIDTRHLRSWLREHCAGLRVLNTFAYTGSLGVAAMAGGAKRVVQTDLNRVFLNVAKDSCSLNGFPIIKSDTLSGDFFRVTAGLRRRGELFDVVIADPPFFSTTAGGRVDMVSDSPRLLNKLRPLVADGGWLVAVNNALYLSGKDYLEELETLCGDGYLSIDSLIPVPEDITGLDIASRSMLPADPAPFNHPTKIALLRVRRK